MERLKVRVHVECGNYNKTTKYCEDAPAGATPEWLDALLKSCADNIVDLTKGECSKCAKPQRARKKAAKKTAKKSAKAVEASA